MISVGPREIKKVTNLENELLIILFGERWPYFQHFQNLTLRNSTKKCFFHQFFPRVDFSVAQSQRRNQGALLQLLVKLEFGLRFERVAKDLKNKIAIH